MLSRRSASDTPCTAIGTMFALASRVLETKRSRAVLRSVVAATVLLAAACGDDLQITIGDAQVTYEVREAGQALVGQFRILTPVACDDPFMGCATPPASVEAILFLREGPGIFRNTEQSSGPAIDVGDGAVGFDLDIETSVPPDEHMVWLRMISTSSETSTYLELPLTVVDGD